MLPLLKSLSPPLVSLIFMMMASGLFNTFVSLRLEMEGYSPEEIGIVTASLYTGVLIGSFWIGRWIAKVGHIRSFIVFALVLAAIVLAQAFWVHSWYWSVLRLIGGMCMAGVFIVIESWFLMQSGPSKRGVALSLYLAVFYVALSSGQLLIDAADPMGILPFCITAFFLLCSIIPISLSKTGVPVQAEHVRLSVGQLFRISPLGFIGSVVSGMLLAAVYGLVPIYAKESGMNISQIGVFMAVLIFGGFSLQWPMGKWADKSGRRKVLNIASFGTAILALALALLPPTATVPLFILAFIFGGFSFTIYPLSMAYACDGVKESQIVAVTGGFVLSYGIGAIIGPLLAPVAMQFLGSSGLFYFLGAITLALGFIGLKQPSSVIVDEE